METSCLWSSLCFWLQTVVRQEGLFEEHFTLLMLLIAFMLCIISHILHQYKQKYCNIKELNKTGKYILPIVSNVLSDNLVYQTHYVLIVQQLPFYYQLMQQQYIHTHRQKKTKLVEAGRQKAQLITKKSSPIHLMYILFGQGPRILLQNTKNYKRYDTF